MAPQYQSQIEQAAQTIDTRNLLSMVRAGLRAASGQPEAQ